MFSLFSLLLFSFLFCYVIFTSFFLSFLFSFLFNVFFYFTEGSGDESLLCGDPGVPTHGSRLTYNKTVFEPGDQVDFSCDPGYKLVGSSTISCVDVYGVGGLWTSSIPACQGIVVITIMHSKYIAMLSQPFHNYTLKTPGSNLTRKRSIGAKLHSESTPIRKSVNLTRNMTQSWVNLTQLFVKLAES